MSDIMAMFAMLTLQDWANSAIVVAGFVGVLVLLMNLVQVFLNRRFQRETVAKITYREYLSTTLKYPLFGDGNVEGLQGEERSRYEWFVSLFLLAAEEVVEYASYDEEWINAILEEASRHNAYLNSKYMRDTELRFYSKKLQRVINEALMA